MRKRPTGVVVLALLALIVGILTMLGNMALISLGGLGSKIAISGLIGIVVSLLYLALALGALTLRPWAWLLGIAVGALGIVGAGLAYMSVPSQLVVVIVTIAINVVIIYYLNTPTVKAAFGRG